MHCRSRLRWRWGKGRAEQPLNNSRPGTAAGGESAAVSGGQRGPPPQSLRDSSPSGAAISDLLPPQSGGRAPRSAEVSAGLPLSRCATAPPRGQRFPTSSPRRAGGERRGQRRSARASPSVATRQLPLGGSDFRPPPPAERGESAAVGGGQRRPPPQSLRDSSPSGAAISDLLPPALRGGESAAVSGGQRGPPPQSLRDSSPSGAAISDLLPPQSGRRADPACSELS